MQYFMSQFDKNFFVRRAKRRRPFAAEIETLLIRQWSPPDFLSQLSSSLNEKTTVKLQQYCIENEEVRGRQEGKAVLLPILIYSS